MPFIQEDWVPRQRGLPEYDPELIRESGIIRVLVTTNRNIVTVGSRIRDAMGNWKWGRVKGPIKAWAYLPPPYNGLVLQTPPLKYKISKATNLINAFENIKNSRFNPELTIKKGEKEKTIQWEDVSITEDEWGDVTIELSPDL